MAQTTRARARGGAKATIDHDEIRRWVEERGGKPAVVKRTANGRQPGILRIDFPGFSGEQSLEELGWDEWFERFDSANLAFLHQDETGSGRPSRFNKLVARESVESGDGRRSSRTSSAGTGRRGSSGARGRAKKSASPRGTSGTKRGASGTKRGASGTKRGASGTKRGTSGTKRGSRGDGASGSASRKARSPRAKPRGASRTQSGGKRGSKGRSQSRQK